MGEVINLSLDTGIFTQPRSSDGRHHPTRSRFFRIVFALFLFLFVWFQAGSSRADELFLESADSAAIEKMFSEDFKNMAEQYNKNGDIKHDFAGHFKNIVDQFGLAKFEHYLSMERPMLRFEALVPGNEQGGNCADISEFGGVKFDTYHWFSQLVLGTNKLHFCFVYFGNREPGLSVNIVEPDWSI